MNLIIRVVFGLDIFILWLYSFIYVNGFLEILIGIKSKIFLKDLLI